MKAFIITILSLSFCFSSYSQTKVYGKVVDASTQQPIGYATVTVLNQQSKKIVSGSIANAKGSFQITGLDTGLYAVKVEFIGFQSKEIDSIVIDAVKNTVSLNTIQLTPSAKTLASVVVTSKAPIVENKIDKMVYNVANDITSQGGAAIDVLKKVPQVTVDIDGNVELQGDANIRFLINGKPSSIFGNSLADALASIPASQIKSIEVITSPGAKYDAQGTGGIINIVLKDNKVQGINGTINLSAGTRLENGSLNLNIRHGNIGINAFFSGNVQLSSHTPATQDRLSLDTVNKTTTHLLQNGYTDFKRNGYQSGIGFDWSISKKDNITASVGYNQFNSSNTGFINIDQSTEDINHNALSDTSSFRNSYSRSHISSIDWSLAYKRKFKKDGEELNILYSTSYGRPTINYTQSQTYLTHSIPYVGSESNNPGRDNENNISIDYSYPITKNFMLETGGKAIFQSINSVADVNTLDAALNKYMPDSTQSYQLNYKMKIYAGYVSASFPLFHYLDIKTGMRYEYTNVGIDFPNTSIPSYNSFVPSLVLSHTFNNNSSAKIAYSHRIERPDYGDLNPFMNFSDPYNITTGNPLLQPEIGNNIELGYNKIFSNKATLYIALVERINNHDVKPYTFFYPAYQIGDSAYTNVSVTTRENVGTEYNSGINISGSLPVKNKLNLRSNLQFGQRYVINRLDNTTISGLRFRINLNVTYQFNPTIIMELFGNYNSAVNNIQGRMPQSANYTFAFRKQFWNKKASIGFTATNPFNKYISQITTLSTGNYISYSARLVPYQSFGISFSYKFGKLEFKKPKEDDSNYLNNLPN